MPEATIGGGSEITPSTLTYRSSPREFDKCDWMDLSPRNPLNDLVRGQGNQRLRQEVYDQD
jgi:hypothetical protein